jgi:chemotaxis methyl-accepting protein methylase
MPETIVVSVDVYQCLKKQGQSSASALMLIATSDGSVLEATITNEFQGYKAVSMATAESQSLKEKINFDVSLSFTAPPSHSSFRPLICRNMLITHSRTSRFVYFWNMNFRTREKILPLPAPPLFLTKMNTKSVLLIGSQESSGSTLKLYELEWSAGVYLREVSLCG